MGVLVHDHVSLVFDESAGAVSTEQRSEEIAVVVKVVLAQLGLERFSGFPGVVMRDLRAEVVGDVRLADACSRQSVQTKRRTVQEEAEVGAIDRRESAALEREGAFAVAAESA